MRSRPLVWHVLLEAFNGGNAAYEEVGDRKSPLAARGAPATTFGRDQVSLKLFKLNLTEGGSRSPKEEGEEVTVAPGLESVLKDYGASAAHEALWERDATSLREESPTGVGRIRRILWGRGGSPGGIKPHGATAREAGLGLLKRRV